MLEAVIVIPVLTLGLCGLLFFREHYLSRIGTARLARAAVVAHGMAACKGSSPKDWIGKDLGQYWAGSANQEQQPARGKDTGISYMPSGPEAARASSILGESDSTTSDGKGILNPVTDAEFSGKASVTRKSAEPNGASHSVFESRVQSQSYLSCSDEVRDGDYDQILDMVRDEISSLL